MKHPVWLLVPLAAAWAATCGAQDVHKCVGIGDGGVAYQNAPCSGAQVDVGLVRLPGYADPPERDGATAPAAEAPAAAPMDAPAPATVDPAPADSQQAFPYRTSIALGMTDDQVLNIPNWGRPSRIVRAGRHRGWRETWVYHPASDAPRSLSFIDGRLASIDIGAAPLRLASTAR